MIIAVFGNRNTLTRIMFQYSTIYLVTKTLFSPCRNLTSKALNPSPNKHTHNIFPIPQRSPTNESSMPALVCSVTLCSEKVWRICVCVHVQGCTRVCVCVCVCVCARLFMWLNPANYWRKDYDRRATKISQTNQTDSGTPRHAGPSTICHIMHIVYLGYTWAV